MNFVGDSNNTVQSYDKPFISLSYFYSVTLIKGFLFNVVSSLVKRPRYDFMLSLVILSAKM